MNSIGNRIELLVEKVGITIYQLSKELGHKRPDKFYSIINKGIKPSFDTLEEILNMYPKVDANWLIKGEGEMFKREYQNTQIGEELNYQAGDNIAFEKNIHSSSTYTIPQNKGGKDKEYQIIHNLSEKIKEKEELISLLKKQIELYEQLLKKNTRQ